MALLDNTGFSSVFANTMDDDIAFDNMFGAEEDDELMEFVLANEDGIVIEPQLEEAEVDASSIEKEEPDKDAVEGLAGPDINAKEIEKESSDKLTQDEIEEMFMTNKADEIMEEEAKEKALDTAYESALSDLLRENDADNEAPNTSKEAPTNVASDTQKDIDEAFFSEESWDDTLKNDVDSRGSEEFKMDTTLPQAPIQKPTVPADAEGKNAGPDINAKRIEDEGGTDPELESSFLGEESWDDTMKNDVDSRGSEEFQMDVTLPQDKIEKPTVPADAEGKNAGPDINAKEIEKEGCCGSAKKDVVKEEDNAPAESDPGDTGATADDEEESMEEAFLGKDKSESNYRANKAMTTKINKISNEKFNEEVKNDKVDESFLAEESWDDTLKNDVDSRSTEEFQMDTNLPQAPIQKPTVPSDAEGKNAGPDINAKRIEDEGGTDPELETAFLGEEQKFDDTLKDEVDCRDHGAEFSMDTKLPQDPIQKPTVPANAEGKNAGPDLDAKRIEDEGGTDPELETAFLGEANDNKQSDDLKDIGFQPEKNDGVDEKDMDDVEQLTDNQEVHEGSDELDDDLDLGDSEPEEDDPSDDEDEGEDTIDFDDLELDDLDLDDDEDEGDLEDEGEDGEDSEEVEPDGDDEIDDLEEAFLGEESWDDTLKNDVDSRGSEEFQMDTTLPQAPIQKPTVPSDAEGKNAGPDLDAKRIEDEGGTDPELETAFLGESDKSVEGNMEEPGEDIEDDLMKDAENKSDDLTDAELNDLLADDEEDELIDLADDTI